MKLNALSSKIVIILITAFFSISVHADGNLDISCDANADCSVCFVRVCTDNPVCQGARALCRTKCGPLNDDANRYIKESLEKIKITQSSIQDLSKNIANNEYLHMKNSILVQKQFSRCRDEEALREDLMSSDAAQREFVATLDTLINSKISLGGFMSRLRDGKTLSDRKKMIELNSKIDSNPTIPLETKALMKGFVKTSMDLALDLSAIISEYKKESYTGFEKILTQTTVVMITQCKDQAAEIASQGDGFDNQRNSYMEQMNRLTSEIHNEEINIRAQEARKCK
jgi:hypothetical protein